MSLHPEFLRIPIRRTLWLSAFIWVFSNSGWAQQPTAEDAASASAGNSVSGSESGNQEKGIPDTADRPSKIPPALDVYMGREIARTMHYAGAPWLIREEREREERCSMMLANLGLKNSMTVCDMGCGNGFHTLKIAQLLQDRGQVFAVDVQPTMLKLLRERMEEQGIDNVIPVLGSLHDPRLPIESIDLILLVDVYHEFSHPEPMLAAMKRSLKPDGMIVLVEFRAEDDSVPIKPLHKMSKEQINRELLANGYRLVREFDGLPWQHMMFFGRAEN